MNRATWSKIRVLGAALLLPVAASAAPQLARNIHVDLSHAQPGQSCSTVGQRTRVRFDASAVSFRPTRVEVLLNGAPVAGDRVRYAWPEVTLDGGLLPGRNTVELIAHRKDGSAIQRNIVIKIGDSVHSDDGITLSCTGPENQSADATTVTSSAPEATVLMPRVEYATSPTTVIYASRPVYSSWPYAGGWYGQPHWRWGAGYYGAWPRVWAPGLTLGLAYTWHRHRHYGWRHGGGWHHRWYGGRRHGWHRHGHHR